MKKINPLNIMVLCNQLLYLEALKSLLNTESHLNCKGILMSNSQATRIIKKEDPTLLLVDTNTMGQKVWRFLNEIRNDNPQIKTIILANNNDPIYLDMAKDNGISGYILKSSPIELLMATIKIVKNGGEFFDRGNYGDTDKEISFEKKYKLSKREMEIIKLITNANTTKVIAERLGLSFHTIEAHRKNIHRKLNVNKVTELIRLVADFEN